MKSYAQSPHNFVTNWDTPILIISGVMTSEFHTPKGWPLLILRNTWRSKASLFFSPMEHWVLKPQNGILWQREFRSWLDRWLK
jgi:hypothetical protein